MTRVILPCTSPVSMVSGFLSPRHTLSYVCGWSRRPLDISGTCVYAE